MRCLSVLWERLDWTQIDNLVGGFIFSVLHEFSAMLFACFSPITVIYQTDLVFYGVFHEYGMRDFYLGTNSAKKQHLFRLRYGQIKTTE